MAEHTAWNCKIPSGIDQLAELQRVALWIPGPANVRPSEEVKEAKAAHIDSVLRMYATEGDYVMATVLGAATEADMNGLLRACPLAARHKCLQRNEFPYQMPEGTRHFVMWYSYELDAVADEPEITADIEQALRTRCRSDAFEFVWYLNPKMTIPDIFHVQVFWRSR
jgi:hypothetical protein